MNTFCSLAGAAAVCAMTACATTSDRGPQPSASDPTPAPLLGEAKDPRTRAKARTDLAAAYYELGNLSVALEEVRAALAADPGYAPAYNVQGLLDMELKDRQAAEASFKRGLQLAPQDPDLNHNYGWFLCQTERADESRQWFLNAARNPLYSSPAKTYATLGRCLRTRNPKEAATYLDRALRLDPNYAPAMLPYAEMLYEAGQLMPAKELVNRYHKLLPDPTAESLWLALRIERKLGDRTAESSYAAQLRRRYSNSNEYRALVRGQYE